MRKASLLGFHNHIERHRPPDLPATIMPLLSQPIIELCLSIPGWSWFDGGINLSVARAAFADRRPTATVRRTVKGRPDSFALEIYDAHRDTQREMLGEGLLRQKGDYRLAWCGDGPDQHCALRRGCGCWPVLHVEPGEEFGHDE
ncbi:asparagine synthase-related protein [Sphingobium sp. Z007]|uniref:asparagine synthase-related protein n=1 Tax=Sphingobium sp. Z007 TaxID=627495 RepID=UPI001124EAD9|nr:asparagine synthase-related protein [Sphingobium sp. Z007]